MYDNELKTLIEEQGRAFEKFQSRYDSKLSEEKAEREELEVRMNRRGLHSVSISGDLRKVGEAFRKYLKNGDENELKSLAETKAMSIGSDPDGGYTVFPEFSSALTKKVFEISPFRQYARTVTISSDAFEEIEDTNEPDASWVGETTSRTDTDSPQIGKLRIPVHEVYAMPKITQKLLDDSAIDIGEWLVSKLGTRFARLEGAAFINGDGIAKPKGILSYTTSSTDDSTRAWGTIQYIPTGNASSFTASDPCDVLIDLQMSLKAEYRANAVWVMNRATAGTVRKFKDGSGDYLWARGLAGQSDSLLGHPVVLAEDMDAIGANAYPIAFGDFRSGYTIVDRHGDRLLRDPYTDKPNVKFYTYRRVGGAVNNTEAIKLLKVAAS